MDIKSINSYSGYKDTGICSNHRFYLSFFRSKGFIGIIIKEYSYFSDFSGRLFYIPNLLFYNLFRCISGILNAISLRFSGVIGSLDGFTGFSSNKEG